MLEDLTGTVVLVTGASSGIGAATARELARRGAHVALLARRRELLERVADEIATFDGRASSTATTGPVLVLEADISDRAQARAAVERTVAHFGRLDTLVNNAGLMLVGPVTDAPEQEWQRMIDVNINGVLHVTHAAIPHLVSAAGRPPRQVADIVNISSTAGRVARGGTAVYNLTKFGLGAFSEALRQELQPQHIRVGLIEPGTVDTELASHTRPELRETVVGQTRSIARLQPEDIADAVAYVVASPRRAAVNEVLVRAAAQSW